MVSLPSQSSYQAQSTRTALGDGSGKGIAKAVTRKRTNSEFSGTDSADETNDKTKHKAQRSGELDLIDYSSDENDKFNPTLDNWVPDRFQKAKMRKAMREAQMNDNDGDVETGPGLEQHEMCKASPTIRRTNFPTKTHERSLSGKHDAPSKSEEVVTFNKKRRAMAKKTARAAAAKPTMVKLRRTVPLSSFTGYPSTTSNKESFNDIGFSQDVPEPSVDKESTATAFSLLTSESDYQEQERVNDEEFKEKVRH